jgi:hypothetical protein
MVPVPGYEVASPASSKSVAPVTVVPEPKLTTVVVKAAEKLLVYLAVV